MSLTENKLAPSPHLNPFFKEGQFTLIAGPCSIESAALMGEIAPFLQSLGIAYLRGGIWKLRTQPESFQGLGQGAFEIIQMVQKQWGLQLISEITDPRQIESLLPLVAGFQVGARNMYNYALLKELALYTKPVVLKRAFSATVDEWLNAAQYLTGKAQPPIILCERGIRTFETSSRYTFDLNSALIAKKRSGLPVFVDPSHGVGLREYVAPLLWASAAAGLDGAIIEVHPRPEQALSDGRQSLDFDSFAQALPKLDAILHVFNKKRGPL